MVMIYDKTDDIVTKTAKLNFQYVIFLDRQHTADYQTTNGLLGILNRNGNQDDIMAFLIERNLPLEPVMHFGFPGSERLRRIDFGKT